MTGTVGFLPSPKRTMPLRRRGSPLTIRIPARSSERVQRSCPRHCRDGGLRRRLRVAARIGSTLLPRRRLSGAHPQPRSPLAASAPVAISEAAQPASEPERLQRSSRSPAAARHPAAVGGGIVPPRSWRSPLLPESPSRQLFPAEKTCFAADLAEKLRRRAAPL